MGKNIFTEEKMIMKKKYYTPESQVEQMNIPVILAGSDEVEGGDGNGGSGPHTGESKYVINDYFNWDEE